MRTSWREGALTRWDRWSPTGGYRASAMLPDGIQHVAAAGGRVAGIQADSSGAQSVVVYRLEGAARCAGPLPGG